MTTMLWDEIDDIMFPMEMPPKQFDMITETIAVGSLYSSYDSFQLIVNLAYRYDGDGFKRHSITRAIEKGKTIIRVGIHDMPSEPMDLVLHDLIPSLVTYYKDHPTHRILIHCQVGMSRSASIAIALISKLEGMSMKEAWNLTREKRSIIQPNEGFKAALEKYLAH